MPTGTTRNQQNTCGQTGSGGKFNQFFFEIRSRFKRQLHGGQQLAQTTMEITQGGFQLGFTSVSLIFSGVHCPFLSNRPN